MKNLSEIIKLENTKRVVNSPLVKISGLAYDSRLVKQDFLFFAFPGVHSDGHDYISKAISNGAKAIICEKIPEKTIDDVCYIQVENARTMMSPVSSAFNDNPSQKMAVIGVTGTEGKSSTVWFIYSLLDLAGKKAGFISTVDYKIAKNVERNPEHQTTPEATTIHEKLRVMKENGFEYAVVESSSHGLSPRTGRLLDVAFDVGVMTNVRHEHLEFHGTWECYQKDKSRLFSNLDNVNHNKNIISKEVEVPSFGVVCADDASADFFDNATQKKVYKYSTTKTDVDFYASNIESNEKGYSFDICYDGKSIKASINLPGLFNVENILAAIIVVNKITGISVEKLVPFLKDISPVKGRMYRIDKGQEFEVIVDYAHTPSSFETILPTEKKNTKGKLIVLFGSAGERDTKKRAQQGDIASIYSDIVILTDEDPRGEVPMDILLEIASGCKNKTQDKDLFLIPDRAKAIRKAFSIAKKGDKVLLLGKGHENNIIYKDGAIPWDEIAEAEKALDERR